MPKLAPTENVTRPPRLRASDAGCEATDGARSPDRARRKTPNEFPPATATTPPKPDGIAVWPSAFPPQATTVPSAFNAKLWAPPAATATTPLNPDGVVVRPSPLLPHATIAPSAFNAKL